MSFDYQGLVDDKREIEQIYGPDPRDPKDAALNHLVGYSGVTRIVAYSENGGLGPVTWFEVWCGGTITERVNGLHVEAVRYKAAL